MGFLDLARKRKSIRKFLSKPVEQEKIDSILEAVQLAPSAGNLQAYEIVVVKNPAVIKEIYKGYFSKSTHENVQLLMVFLADLEESGSRYGKRGRELYSIQDATIACAYAQLAATDLGLASVWVGAFDEEVVAKAVNAGNKRPVAFLALGYAAIDPERPPRKNRAFNERLE